MIIVNAQTKPTKQIELSDDEPEIAEVIDAVTDTQIHRYNPETISMAHDNLIKWADELSTSERTIKPYFIEIGLESIHSIPERRFYNNIATSLALPSSQVNRLINKGRLLLRQSEAFQQLINDFSLL